MMTTFYVWLFGSLCTIIIIMLDYDSALLNGIIVVCATTTTMTTQFYNGIASVLLSVTYDSNEERMDGSR